MKVTEEKNCVISVVEDWFKIFVRSILKIQRLVIVICHNAVHRSEAALYTENKIMQVSNCLHPSAVHDSLCFIVLIKFIYLFILQILT